MSQSVGRPPSIPPPQPPTKNPLSLLTPTLKGLPRLSLVESLLGVKSSSLDSLFPNFEKDELIKILDEAEIVTFEDEKQLRVFEVYREVPAVLVMQGCLQLSYLDLEGDRQKLDVLEADKPRLFEASRSLLACSVKQSDLNLLTGFRIETARQQPTVALFLNSLALQQALSSRQQLQVQKIIRQREMYRHYGLQPQTLYTPLPVAKTTCVDKPDYILLVRGKLCIMKDTLLLSCYNEGLFSQLTNKKLGTRFVVLAESMLVYCEDVWKNQKYQEGETRRIKHLEAILAKYQNMTDKETKALQKQFMQVNELNPHDLEEFLPKKKQKRQTLKQQISVGPKLAKKSSLKQDLKSTKTSIQKCTIRIRVKKK